MSELPLGWEHAPLRTVVTFAIGGAWGTATPTDDNSEAVRVIRGAEFKAWATTRAASAPVRFVSRAQLSSRELEVGNVVLEVSGGGPTQPVGRTVLIDGEAIRSTGSSLISSNFCRRLVLTSCVNPKFVWYQLQHAYNRGLTEPFQRATTNIRNLQVDRFLNESSVKLAPRAEQDQIVAVIEENFSRLDAAAVSLLRARRNIARIRTALLDVAVARAIRHSKQDPQALGSVLSESPANGRSVPDGPVDGFPVLRLTAVRDGWIDVTQIKRGDWTPEEAGPYIIRQNDFMVVRGNGSKRLVGRGGRVREDADAAYPDTLIRLRFDRDAVILSYIALIWDSSFVRQQIESSARTTAGIYKINQKDLQKIKLAIPSTEDQLAIYTETASELDALRALEACLSIQVQRLATLRSSILTAAFSGCLVPQDPSDEPASALIQRIATERAASKGLRVTRPRKGPESRERVKA